MAHALRDHARAARRHRALHAHHDLPARRHHLDVAAEVGVHARGAVQDDVAGAHDLLARRVEVGEQRGDHAAPAQVAAVARAVHVVVLAAPGTQLGEVHAAQEHALLLGRQRLEVRERAARVLRVGAGGDEAVAFLEPCGQLGVVGLHHAARLARQRLAGARLGALRGVEVAVGDGREVRPAHAHRAHAGHHRDACAGARVALGQRTATHHAGAVVLRDVAAGRHLQRAGARHLQVRVQDVAPGLHQRHVARVVVHDQRLGADDVAPGADARRRGRAVPGLGRGFAAGLHLARRAAGQAQDVAAHGVEQRGRRIGCVQRAGAQRVRPESEQRVVVDHPVVRHAGRSDHRALRAGVVDHRLLARVVAHEGGCPGRGQRRDRARHPHRIAAAEQRIARQELERARGRRREHQRTAGRLLGRRGREAVVQAARGRRRAQDRRVDRDVVAHVDAAQVPAGGLPVRQVGAGREVAARAEQVDRGAIGPQREPALADAVLGAAELECRAVRHPRAARVGHAGEHQVARRVQVHRRIARHEHDAGIADADGRGEGVDGARVLHIALLARQRERVLAVAHLDAADGGGRHGGRAAQVDQGAVEVLVLRIGARAAVLRRGQVRIDHAADAQLQVAAAGERQLPVRVDAARAADRRHDGLAALPDLAVAQPRGEARVAARAQREVAAAQRAHAGEAHQEGLGAAVGADLRTGRQCVGAEVDPPRRRDAVAAGQGRARALAPQPAAHRGARRLSALAPEMTPDVADDVAAHRDVEVAALLGVPGLVGRERGAVVRRLRADHRAADGLAACEVEGVEAVGVEQRRRARAGRVDAERRLHDEVAGRRQAQVAGAGAQHAEHRRQRRVLGDVLDGVDDRRADARPPLADRDVFGQHRRALDEARVPVVAVGAPEVGKARRVDHAGALTAPVAVARLEIQRVHRRSLVVAPHGPVRTPQEAAAARRELDVVHRVAVGQDERAVLGRIDRAAVGRVQVGAGRELQAPARRALPQHRRHGPVAALHAVDFGPQVDGRVVRQLHIGQRRNHRTARQRDGAVGLHRDRQAHALGPHHRLHAGLGAQRGARAQLHAAVQHHGLAQHRAGLQAHAAVGVVDVGAQHRAGGQRVGRAQGHGHGQHRAGRQRHGFGGHVVVQQRVLREHGALVEHHAVDRHDDVAAVGRERRAELRALLGEVPALVVGRGRRRREAVVDAAVHVEVAARADHQHAGLAEAAPRRVVAVRTRTVAVAREVDVADHAEVALAGAADDLHAGAQVVAAQARQARRQRGVGQRLVDEGAAVAIDLVEVLLRDELRHVARDVGRARQRCVAVGAEGVDRDALRALDGGRAGDVHRHVVVAAPRRVQRERAARCAVVALRRAHGRARAQVDGRAAAQRQRAVRAREVDDGAVRAVDDLAVAVHAQAGGVRVERAVHREVALGREADRAHLEAAGVDAAVHREAAAVERDLDHARLHFVADGEVALLDLEAARAGHAAFVEARVQAREVGHGLAAHADLGRVVGHDGAARVVRAARGAEDASAQVDAARAGAQRRRLQRAAAVVRGRQVDHRTRRLRDVAGRARHLQVAAAAVARLLEELHGAAREVDARIGAQRHVAAGRELQLARGQADRAVDGDVAAGERQLRAQRRIAGRLRARRSAHHDVAARRDAVVRAGLAGEQRGAQVQLAARVVVALARHVRALLVVHAQRALAVGGDALARVQVDRAEAQREPVRRVARVGLRVGRVAQHDARGRHVERAVAQQAADGAARCVPTGKDLVVAGRARREAGPDEFAGRDLRGVARAAVAVDGGRAQHQPFDRRHAGGGVERVQRHRAVDVHRLARVQHQRLDRGHAFALVAGQQVRQDDLVHRQARRQLAVGRRLLQRRVAAQVDRGHGQQQVLRAVAHVVGHRERAVGGHGQRALAVQRGVAGAGAAGARADLDRGGYPPGDGRQQVDPAVRQAQHPAQARREHHAVGGIVGRRTGAQRVQRRALLHLDAVAVAAGHEEDFGAAQGRAAAHDDMAGVRLEGRVVVGIRQIDLATQDHPWRAEGVELVGLQRRAREPGRALRARRRHLDGDALRRQRAAEARAAGRRVEQRRAVELQHRHAVLRLGIEVVQQQVAGVGRDLAAHAAAACRVGHHEGVVAHLVVAGVLLHQRRRRDDQLAGQRRLHRRVRHAEVAARHVRAVAGRQRRRGQRALRPHFHAEGTGQQRVGRRQQRVGAGLEPAHVVIERDLPADGRLARAGVGRHRRVAALEARHDGVHAVARLAEGVGRVGIGQRRAQHVHRTAATAHEARARELAAARQVEQRALVPDHAVAREQDAAAADGALVDGRAGHAVADAVGRAAVGHEQAGAADRGDAARQQVDHGGARLEGAAPVLPHDQVAQRRAHDAALAHRAAAERQRAECRLRHRHVAFDLAADVQHAALVVARADLRVGAGGGVDLRGGEREVAQRRQLGRGRAEQAERGRAAQQAQVAAAGHAHGVEAAAVHHLRGAGLHGDLAVRAEAHAVADVDQVGLGREGGLARAGRCAVAPGGGVDHLVVLLGRTGHAGQPQVGRGEPHARIGGRAVGQREAAGVQAQALRGREVDVAVEAQQAVDQQREVAEAAVPHLVRAQAPLAVGQRRIGMARLEGGRQSAGLLRLRDHQLARLPHGVVDGVDLREHRRFERHRERAARRIRAARVGAQRAVQVQAVRRLEHDAAAVAGHVELAPQATGRRHVDARMAARGIEQRAGADDDREVGCVGRALGFPVERAADGNGAAVAHRAVAAAVVVDAGLRARRHVEHRALADPHRAVVRLQRRAQRRVESRRLDVDGDAPAPGVEPAIDHEAAQAAAEQLDRAARIDRHHRPRADGEVAAFGDAALRTQHEVGALALHGLAVHRVLLQQRRRPQLQCDAGFMIGTGPGRDAVDRHEHVELRARRDREARVAVEVVGGKARLQARRVEHELRRVRQRRVGADEQRVARFDLQRAAAVHAMAADLAAERQAPLRIGGRRGRVGHQRHVAALAALLLALGQQRRARRHVDQAALPDRHAVRRFEAHRAAVDDRERGRVFRRRADVDAASAQVERDAVAHGERRIGVLRQHARLGARHRRHEDIAGFQRAAAHRDVGADVDERAEQGHAPAVGQRERLLDVDAAARADVQHRQALRIQVRRVEPQRADALVGQCVGRGHLLRDRCHVAEAHVGVEQVDAAERAVAPHRQHAAARHRALRLAVAVVQRGVACACLLRAVEHLGHDVAFEHRRGRAHHQPAGVAPDGVAVLQLALRPDQRVVEIVGVRLAPAHVLGLEALVDAVVQQVRRRAVQVVQPTVTALEPGLVDLAGLHVERTARQVDLRARLRDHLAAAQHHRAALRGPFADAVALVAQVAADLQQAARRVPALALVAAHAGRHAHELAPVDPHVVVEQLAALAVARGVAHLVALHVDLDVVRFHRHVHAHRARHIEARLVGHEAAARGAGRDLPAGGQRERLALEADVAARDDLDARLVAPVRQPREVVEERGRHERARGVLRGRLLEERVALAVERAGLAVVLDQHGRDRALADGDVAARVGGRVQQVHRAAHGDGGGGQRHAVLAHVAAGQRDVAFARHDEAGVAHRARRAVGRELRRDLVAARGREGIGLGAHALADHEAVARRELRLALARGDLAGVGHLLAQQQHVAAALRDGAGLLGGQARAGLHLDLALVFLARGEARRGVVRVDAARLELVVADVGGRRHEVARVGLAGAAEHDAVAVGDEHRAVGLDLPLDLRRPRLRVVHAVEHGPVGLLLEIDRGVAPDVEGLPVQDGLVAGLLHGDDGAAVDLLLRIAVERAGVEPAGAERIRVDLQAAVGQAVGHRGLVLRGGACGGLRGLLRGDRLRREAQVAERLAQLLVGLLLLRQRVRQHRGRRAVGQVARRGGRALRHVLLRHPRGAEGALRLCIARQARHGQREGGGVRDRRAAECLVAHVIPQRKTVLEKRPGSPDATDTRAAKVRENLRTKTTRRFFHSRVTQRG
ncbi:hypothetical protein D3C87_803050 [compost metagenome]